MFDIRKEDCKECSKCDLNDGTNQWQTECLKCPVPVGTMVVEGWKNSFDFKSREEVEHKIVRQCKEAFDKCKLELAKAVIAEHYKDAPCGIFPCRNDAGDDMTVLFKLYGLRIEICYCWRYFEVFGLTDEEFKELEQYYDTLRGKDE